jgi:hypothetical protein
MSYSSQLQGFLKRNFILKYRNKFQTVMEIYNPLAILAILILFSFIFKSERFEAEDFNVENITTPFLGLELYISPDRIGAREITAKIKYINSVKYFNSTDEMKRNYTESADADRLRTHIGVAFNQNHFPFEYKLFTQWDDELFSRKKAQLVSDSRRCRKNLTSILNDYRSCAGNKLLYNGLAYFQYNLDLAIKIVIKALIFFHFFISFVHSLFFTKFQVSKLQFSTAKTASAKHAQKRISQ